MNKLLNLEMLARWNPSRRKLVHVGEPLSPALNMFFDHGVDILPAFLYSETFNSKVSVAYKLVLEGIRRGDITPETTVLIASSGNTGLGVAMFCKALGIKSEVVMQADVPATKVNTIRALGYPITVTLLNEGTVAYARKKGAEPGYFNADQYGDRSNIDAQCEYIAPQLWHGIGHADVVITAGGTLGTAGGLKKSADEFELTTKVGIGICADGQEIPAARTRAKILREVTIASPDDFFYCGTAGRHEAFLASYAMFQEVEWLAGGPTSGLALFVALSFLQKHLDAKTLDQFRGPNGRVRLVFLCPDDYRPYADLYLSTLNFAEFSSTSVGSIPKLLDVVRESPAT